MEQYEEIDLGSFKTSSQPFTIAFAFPETGPIVVKGMLKEVQDYIWVNLAKCHYKVTFWNNQRKMNENWYVNDPEWTVLCKIEDSGKRRYIFFHLGEQVFVLRRMPKHFIKELLT
jgi:hypothetical protein